MDYFGVADFAGASFAVKKKRSTASRQPCSDSRKLLETCVFLPLCSQPLGTGNNEEGCYFRERAANSDGVRSENKLRKLKLKLGGVTHTIHTNSATEYAVSGGSYVSNSFRYFDSSYQREEFLLQDSGLRKMPSETAFVNETHRYEPVRKSKRIPKKRVIDMEFNEEDDEIRYLGKHTASRIYNEKDEKNNRKQARVKVSNGRQMDEWFYADMGSYESSKPSKNGRKMFGSEKITYDKDSVEEKEPPSGDEPEHKSNKLGFIVGRKESSRAHGRSLQSPNHVILESGASLIEFPNGLPPAPPKKEKVKLSDVELHLKKAEAAQRRRMQSENAAREAEAEAIRKILGQDSGRKKKEEKIKKQRKELAQGKAAKTNALESNTVRWVIGPTGTVVIFSDDIGLPNIFNSGLCSYPAPREKCVGPNCTNAYKYRDSKSKLPLCSLQCYQAIHGEMQSLITC